MTQIYTYIYIQKKCKIQDARKNYSYVNSGCESLQPMTRTAKNNEKDIRKNHPPIRAKKKTTHLYHQVDLNHTTSLLDGKPKNSISV